MRRLLAAAVLLGWPAVLRAQHADSIRSLGEALRAARAASEARDWKAAQRALTAGLVFSPGNPALVYNLARAQARSGDRASALRQLERLARQGIVREVAEDSAFQSLRGSRQFRRIAERLAAAAAPVTRSDTAFVLPDPDFIPEGIAGDPGDGAFYVGSLNGRGIVRVTRDTVVSWIRPDSTRRVMVLGLRVDPVGQRLWVASLVPDSAAPRFLRGIGGWAALEAYQIPTARRVGRWVPDSTGPHLFNDIAIASGGDVYVTDSEGGALFRLPGGAGTLERVHHDPARFIYPNGIATSADGSRLYVASWEGLTRFDLTSTGKPTPQRVPAAPGIATTVIDGLYRCGSSLLAVQYLLDFPQITQLVLSGDGESVADARALERRHPAQTSPTTGAPAGNAFFYLANAQLERLGPDHSVGAGSGELSVILRLPLAEPCGG
jgi:sugar lactone lactonase YvrE